MKHDARLIPAALGAWGVAALITQTSVTLGIRVTIAAAALALTAVLWRWYSVALASAMITSVALVSSFRLDVVETSDTSLMAERNAAATVRMRLVTDPRPTGDGTADARWFWGRVTHASEGDPAAGARREARPTAGVLIAVSAGSDLGVEDAAAGEWLTVSARLQPHEASRFAARAVVLDVVDREAAAWWWTWSQPVRQSIGDAAQRGPPGGAALVPALVHGDESAQDAWTKEAFQTSGLTHLMAVSGTNLTIVLGCVLLIGRSIGIGGRGRIVLGVVAVVGFVILARPEPSVVRAAVMGSVGVLGLMRSSRGGLRALAWAICAMMLYDPWMSTQVGFILSVSATAGIIVLVPWWTGLLDLSRPIALALTVPLAAHVACAPTVVVLSDEVSLVAVYANAVATPFVAPATVLGLVAGVVRLASADLGDPVGWAASWSAEVIVVIAHRASSFEGAAIAWDRPWWVLAACCLAVATVLPQVLRRGAIALVAAAGLTLVVWQPWGSGWPTSDWVVVVCDVGQGSAAVINAGAGAAVVVDAGEEPQAVHRCLERLEIDRVALFVASHAHADHVGGWEGVWRGRTVDRQAVGPGVEPRPGDTPVLELSAGMRLESGRATVEVLAPRARPGAAPPLNENDDSVVLRATIDGVSVLLPGDLESTGQTRVARSPGAVADVFVVPHHGSGNHDPALAEATEAGEAIISVGSDNRHGHPHPDLLETLRKSGMTTWRTDVHGDLAVLSTPGGARIVARRSGRWEVGHPGPRKRVRGSPSR